MENFEQDVAKDKRQEVKRGPIQYNFKDGTIGFFDTPQELIDAIEAEKENSN